MSLNSIEIRRLNIKSFLIDVTFGILPLLLKLLLLLEARASSCTFDHVSLFGCQACVWVFFLLSSQFSFLSMGPSSVYYLNSYESFKHTESRKTKRNIKQILHENRKLCVMRDCPPPHPCHHLTAKYFFSCINMNVNSSLLNCEIFLCFIILLYEITSP